MKIFSMRLEDEKKIRKWGDGKMGWKMKISKYGKPRLLSDMV